ncbi:hypothetical protein EXIGLDRAFT_774773 [Exidia glandulosa HHB12029]|uniref:DUF6535 domain-containing protein n=1 Tax=Exidia glandulosa HHB12029 TaxID=1314781 RepID=A0A165E8E2_EXIGL|nr:hypothetical protein EXIGLDRAFT_774773 [Exidia glandulosa HHB12029]
MSTSAQPQYMLFSGYSTDCQQCEHDRPPASAEQKELFNRMSDLDAVLEPSYPPEELDTDFKKRYPPDPFGEETARDARVWSIYRDEATARDEPMVDGWNKALDILLIFAGLFSAVATAFIVEAYKALLPDYEAYVANALWALAASGNGSASLDTVTVLGDPSSFVVSRLSRWVNGLWFVSVTLALAVALLCILVKQWLQHYISRVTAPSPSPRDWARRRSFYYEGLLRWHLPGLISTLPLLLHLSLFVFLTGLVLFVWNIDHILGMGLLGLTLALFGFYVFSFVVPALRLDCPSMTPLMEQLMRLDRLRFFLKSLILAMQGRVISRIPRPRAPDVDTGRQSESASYGTRIRLIGGWLAAALFGIYSRLRFALQDLRDMRLSSFYHIHVRKAVLPLEVLEPYGMTDESLILDRRAPELDATTISWLLRSCANYDTLSVALQATGSIHPGSRTTALFKDDLTVRSKVYHAFDYARNALHPETVAVSKLRSAPDLARFLRVAYAQTPGPGGSIFVSYCWSGREPTVQRDYDLSIFSHIYHGSPHGPGGLDGICARILGVVHTVTRLGARSPFLHSNAVLMFGQRGLTLETRLALLALFDYSKITDEDAQYAVATLTSHLGSAGHRHTHPCNRECLLDVLSAIALANVEQEVQYLRDWVQSTVLFLIRSLLKSRLTHVWSYDRGMDIRKASAQYCLGLAIPHFLDLLSSGLYAEESLDDWANVASYLINAVESYGPARITTMRCQQLLRIIAHALCRVPPNEQPTLLPWDGQDHRLLFIMCSVVGRLFKPNHYLEYPMLSYRPARLASLYRTQLQVAHETSSAHDGLLPLLHCTADNPSSWSVVTTSYNPKNTAPIALVLSIQLCAGWRRGIPGFSVLVDEFFAYDWGLKALRASGGGTRGTSSESDLWALHLIVHHCVELKSDWWENVRAKVDAENDPLALVPITSDLRYADKDRVDLRAYDEWSQPAFLSGAVGPVVLRLVLDLRTELLPCVLRLEPTPAATASQLSLPGGDTSCFKTGCFEEIIEYKIATRVLDSASDA